MRRARAYRTSWSQVVLVCLYPFRRNLLSAENNCKRIPQNPYFGGSKSSMLIPLHSTSPLLVMISSTFMPTCNRFHVGQANNGQNKPLFWMAPLLTLMRKLP